MGYLALYRKFRPQRFQDLVGQDSVVNALVNQIATDRIGHAYLFCGARGTGKTTAAKIFARAINCETKSGEPCGECSVCKSLLDAANLDVVEMDAASNNKVENVREIREKVQYPPVNGRFKVYIIDEVHMLTQEAFNALLKTLEEPPKHAVFVLATTEPHKLPQTILSRCMRFDFKLIPTAKIAKLIAEIFSKEGKDFEESAVLEIARAGEGSVRDALSVADICLSYNNGKLTYKDVIEVLGASDRSKVLTLAKAVFSNDVGEVLKIVDGLLELGKSVGMLARDLLNACREIMVAKTCVNAKDILALPEDEIERIDGVAKLIDNHGILRIVEILSQIENDLKFSTQPRVIFETALVKATMPQNDYNIDALLSRISKLEQLVQNGFERKVGFENKVEKAENLTKTVERPQTAEKVVEVEKVEKPQVVENKVEKAEILTETVERPQTIENVQEKVEVKVQELTNTPESPKADNQFTSAVPDRRLWGSILRKLRDNKQSVLWAVCQELDAKVENGVLYVIATEENEYSAISKPKNVELLTEVLQSFCNYSLKIVKEQPKTDDFEQDLSKIAQDFDVKIVD